MELPRTPLISRQNWHRIAVSALVDNSAAIQAPTAPASCSVSYAYDATNRLLTAN